VPFSTLGVRLAVDVRTCLLVQCAGCPLPSVAEHTWRRLSWAAIVGRLYTLWVYREVDAISQDWESASAEELASKFDCELSLGFVYWNENLLMASDVWLLASAFLELFPS